jgi:hypothetical protein
LDNFIEKYWIKYVQSLPLWRLVLFLPFSKDHEAAGCLRQELKRQVAMLFWTPYAAD